MRTQRDISTVCVPKAECVYPTNSSPINASEAERVRQGTPAWHTINVSEAVCVYPITNNPTNMSEAERARLGTLCFGLVECVQSGACVSY